MVTSYTLYSNIPMQSRSEWAFAVNENMIVNHSWFLIRFNNIPKELYLFLFVCLRVCPFFCFSNSGRIFSIFSSARQYFSFPINSSVYICLLLNFLLVYPFAGLVIAVSISVCVFMNITLSASKHLSGLLVYWLKGKNELFK